jgi:DNA-binding CsgD family transcriptional regulator
MTMQKRPQTLIHNSLSSSELIILRSIALGLGCDTIRDLLELSEKAYRKECESLFQKLEVCNAYAAVQKAYFTKILKNKEYTPEKVKGLALKFAHHYEDQIKCTKDESKRVIWELYDLLLEFYNEVESSYMLTPKNKKSHRSRI